MSSRCSKRSWKTTEEIREDEIHRGTVLRLLKMTLRHWRTLGLGLLAAVTGTCVILLEPRLFGYAVDEAIVPRNLERLQLLSLVYLGLTCLRGLAGVQQGYLFEKLGQKVTQDLRILVFTHLQKLPLQVYDRTPTGRLLTRVTNDIASLNEMFSAGFLVMFCNLILVAGILGWLFSLNLKLGLISSSVFPVLVLISAGFSVQLRYAYRQARSQLSALNAYLAESLSGIKIIHLFNRKNLHIHRFETFNKKYANAQVNTIRVFAYFQPTITIASGITIALVIWFGGTDAWSGTLKIGVLIAYISYALSLFQPVREIADKWNIFVSGLASAERIFSILSWKTELELEEGQAPARPIRGIRGHIIFENIWFSYDGGTKWIFKDLSLEIRPGETIGVVGHTGAGKSSLIRLLLRFYDPQRGRILIDGKDIRDYDKRQLRASFGIIQQDVFLFSGSFEDNIWFWDTTTLDSKARADQMAAMIAQLGQGGLKNYFKNILKKSVLAERGSNFSMGERQVIAFARALLKDPPIWVLDEATSNLDSESERIVQACLKRVTQSSENRKTCILIAHRLATVRDADRIIVLNEGSLVEVGDHETLILRNGFYARLHRFQEVIQK